MIRYTENDELLKKSLFNKSTIYQRELALARDFILKNQPDDKTMIKDHCPISGRKFSKIFFNKWGYDYAFCSELWSLSIKQQIDSELNHNYFKNSELSNYRSSEFFQNELSQSRDYVWNHYIEWVKGRVTRYLGNNKYDVIDWGGKFNGLIDMLASTSFVGEFSTQDTLYGVGRNEGALKKADVICLTGVIQRLNNPFTILSEVKKYLKTNGILIITTRSGVGFDLLTMGSRASTIFPLDHQCLPSPKGLALILENTGYEVLEVTTPGMVDVENIILHE